MNAFGDVYKGRRILLTGDTGFKGAWLAHWLMQLGAEVHGLALPPENDSTLYVQTGLAGKIDHVDQDIRDADGLRAQVERVKPELILHLAAQPLVRESYRDPLTTWQTNVLGTANLLDAVRTLQRPCTVLIITTDKVYQNREWAYGYRDVDPLGGHDPYSASKAGAELVTASYRDSFFPLDRLEEHGCPVASARAGNVIGPGDWAEDRIVPDAIRALAADQAIPVRNPHSQRPWQHVLEPLSGYLLLGQRLLSDDAAKVCSGWNFGPSYDALKPVQALVERIVKAWGRGNWSDQSDPDAVHEARLLWLNIDRAVFELGWTPVWRFETTIQRTVEGYKRLLEAGKDADAASGYLAEEIEAYIASARAAEML